MKYYSESKKCEYSIEDIIKISGMTRRTIQNNLKNGWSVDEVLGFKKHIRRGVIFHHSDIQNRDYMVIELSEITGKSVTTIRDKLKDGVSVDEILGLVKRDSLNKKTYHSEIQNHEYTITELSRLTGKSFSTIRENIYKYGWSVDEILGLDEHINPRVQFYHSEIHNRNYSIKELSKLTQKSISSIRDNLRKGWCVDEILGLVKRDVSNTKHYHSNIQNRDYTLKELATLTGYTKELLASRIQRGNWTVDELLGLTRRITLNTKLYHSDVKNCDYSIDELIKISGNSKSVVKSRLRSGYWTIDNILNYTPPLAVYSHLKFVKCKIYINDLVVIAKAYSTDSMDFYECIDQKTNQTYIKSKSELIELWIEKGGKYK